MEVMQVRYKVLEDQHLQRWLLIFLHGDTAEPENKRSQTVLGVYSPPYKE